MASTELNDPAVSYYCKFVVPRLFLLILCIPANLVGGSIQATSEQVLVPDTMVASSLIEGASKSQESRLRANARSRWTKRVSTNSTGDEEDNQDCNILICDISSSRICTLTGSLEAIALAKELINKAK